RPLAPTELTPGRGAPARGRPTSLRAMAGGRGAFPLIGVAAVRPGETIRIALAGVAPTPWTLDAPAALDDATPLPGTAYKVEIARALIRRALEHVSSPPSS